MVVIYEKNNQIVVDCSCIDTDGKNYCTNGINRNQKQPRVPPSYLSLKKRRKPKATSFSEASITKVEVKT